MRIADIQRSRKTEVAGIRFGFTFRVDAVSATPITSPEGSLAELRDQKILRAFEDEHIIRVRLSFPSHLI